MSAIIRYSQEYRIAITRTLGALMAFFVLFSTQSWGGRFFLNMAVDLAAFVLVLIATFGRLWSLAYISGHKTKKLITEGPYSMVRNPLYLFSLIGALGIGLVSKNIFVLAVIILLYGICYPFVILAEEKHLQDVHGPDFQEYKSRTPMLIPKPSLYHDMPAYTINTRHFRRSFFSVMWFPLIFILMLLIERLRGYGLLPVLIVTP